ncbi:MAG: RAMP superfamily CRISPR-associated protein [Candidatus Xenobiia bacterium LiM19]
MRKLTLELLLLSNTLIGSGEGFGAIIDTDIIFDDTGIPYIPAKRIKGCLRDSAEQVKRMFEISDISIPIHTDTIFGKQGQDKTCPVCFSNLVIQDYEACAQWFEYLTHDDSLGKIVTKDRIIRSFTDIRQQTRISEERGVAEDHSLRTIRLIKKGVAFFGDVEIDHCENEDDVINTLALASINLRLLGTKRTRGLGEVQCALKEKGVPIPIMNKVEALCNN